MPGIEQCSVFSVRCSDGELTVPLSGYWIPGTEQCSAFSVRCSDGELTVPLSGY